MPTPLLHDKMSKWNACRKGGTLENCAREWIDIIGRWDKGGKVIFVAGIVKDIIGILG